MKTQAHKIIQEIEQKSFNEGFQAGWYAASKQAYESLKKPIFPAFSAEDDQAPVATGNPFKAGTGSASVYDHIKNNPGKKGKDIISDLGISPKIVRNVFHRLKDRGLAVNEDGWRILR